MTRPHKNSRTGIYYFRQKTPADLRMGYGKTETVRSLHTKDASLAKLRCAEEAAKQAKIWQAMRAVPSVLPHKQIMALVGDYRRQMDADLEDEPGEVGIWENVLRLESSAGADLSALERWAGAEANGLLLAAGLAADPHSRARLMTEMHKARLEWVAFQLRRAGGDYSPDPTTHRFPEWRPSDAAESALSGGTGGGVTLTALFTLWETNHIANGKTTTTVTDFRHKVASLRNCLGHDDALRVTGRVVDEWCDHLRASGLTAKTVGEKYLAAVKRIFALAVRKHRLPSSPVEKNRVDVPKATKERLSGFTEAEATSILKAAMADPASLGKRPEKTKQAIRWVPWICAYTGARVGEIAQLRREDLIEEYGIPCLRITPEGGTVKTGNYRIVPLHPHLLELRLGEFIAGQPSGPLFFSTDGPDVNAATRAQNTGAKVGQWVRKDVGIIDPRVQPNHAWRHRFKTLCRDAGIDLETRNAIQGHGDGTAASGYGEVTIATMKRAIDTFPRVSV